MLVRIKRNLKHKTTTYDHSEAVVIFCTVTNIRYNCPIAMSTEYQLNDFVRT